MADNHVRSSLGRHAECSCEGRRGPMRQGDLLEPTCQALARARAQSQRGGTGCDDMYPNLSSPQPVPLALEARRPVVQQVRFIEQNNCAPRQRNPLRPAPQALPKAR